MPWKPWNPAHHAAFILELRDLHGVVGLRSVVDVQLYVVRLKGKSRALMAQEMACVIMANIPQESTARVMYTVVNVLYATKCVSDVFQIGFEWKPG